MRITTTEWNDLARLGRAIRLAEDEIRHEAATTFQHLAQAEAPVETGFLRDNIVIEEQGDRTILVIALAFYAFLVNGGTRFQAANPFWDRALVQFGPILDELAGRAWMKHARGA